jgi:hypothetical protein
MSDPSRSWQARTTELGWLGDQAQGNTSHTQIEFKWFPGIVGRYLLLSFYRGGSLMPCSRMLCIWLIKLALYCYLTLDLCPKSYMQLVDDCIQFLVKLGLLRLQLSYAHVVTLTKPPKNWSIIFGVVFVQIRCATYCWIVIEIALLTTSNILNLEEKCIHTTFQSLLPYYWNNWLGQRKKKCGSLKWDPKRAH